MKVAQINYSLLSARSLLIIDVFLEIRAAPPLGVVSWPNTKGRTSKVKRAELIEKKFNQQPPFDRPCILINFSTTSLQSTLLVIGFKLDYQFIPPFVEQKKP